MNCDNMAVIPEGHCLSNYGSAWINSVHDGSIYNNEDEKSSSRRE
jgi:hypothetical protein